MRDKLLTVAIVCCLAMGLLMGAYSVNEFAKQSRQNDTIDQAISNYYTQPIVTAGPIIEQTNQEPTFNDIALETVKPAVITRGVIYIEKIDVRAPVAIGVDDYTFKSHAGMYPSLGTPDKSSLVAIATHSSVLKDCRYCFFQNIDQLLIGDIIKLDFDGAHYVYEIQEVTAYQSPDSTHYFEAIDGQDTLVLVTCTHGDRNIRTFVVAKLTEETT